MRIIWAIILLGACSRHKSEATVEPTDTVQRQHENYLAWSNGLVDHNGFPSVDNCDGLLWACLRYVSGAKVNWHVAEVSPGQWFRDSAHQCGPSNGSSKSTISNDMLVGLLYCIWKDKDAGTADDVIRYANQHLGSMGQGSDATISPLTYYLFNVVSAKIKGHDLPPFLVDVPKDILTGFQAHLAVLGILLDGIAHGSVSGAELDVLKEQADRQPRNALYQAVYHLYTDGKQDMALAVLGDDSLFPAGRLPSSSDRATFYLWMRDEPSPDWSPGSPGQTWDGTDFIFAATVLAGGLQGDRSGHLHDSGGDPGARNP